MSFEEPLLLLTLAVVPLALVGYLLLQRRRNRYAVSFTNLEVLAGVVERTPTWRRHLPAALFLFALAALCVGISRPTVSLAAAREKATVVLVVDVSGSMRAKDVKPTRLEAAKRAMVTFLERVPKKLRVAIVSFSDEPQLVAPPTTDRTLLRQSVALLSPGFGTAIGDALVRAVEAVQPPEGGNVVPPKPNEKPLNSILLLSDGFQTRGVATPLEGAQLAKEAGIPVYTVALGTPDGTIEVFRFGERAVVPVPPDPATLSQIAEETGGEFFDAPNAARAQSAYERLGSEIGREEAPREATVAFVAGGALLLLSAAAFSGLWLPRLP